VLPLVKVEGTIEEIARLFADAPGPKKAPSKRATKAATPGTPKKATRKPSKYNLHMKKELKRLKKLHPRTKQSQLMKKAARSWRKAK
jgi:hypothetical protein